jgi:hypothetical protein
VDRSADWQGERGGRHAEGDPRAGRCKAAKEKAFQIIEKLKIMRLARAAEIVESGIDETLNYYAMQMWKAKSASHIRTASTAAAD